MSKTLDFKKNLKELVYTPAPSGYEWSLGMAEKIQSLIGKKGLRIGNNLVYEIGQGSKTIFISAHMDEVGFFIKNEGKIYLNPIGSIDPESVRNTRIDIYQFAGTGSQKIDQGLVLSEVEPATFSNLSVKTEKSKTICTGAIATFSKTYVCNDDIVCATSLDNKVGVVALISLIQLFSQQNLDDIRLIFCFAAGEEQGMNAVMNAVRKFNPDFCIDIDSAYGRPYIDDNIDYWSIPEIGKGPALQLMGQEWVLPDYLREFVERLAKSQKISLQYEIPAGDEGGTQSLFYAASGYPFIQINIPVAHQHTAQSSSSLQDIKETIAVTEHIVRNIPSIL